MRLSTAIDAALVLLVVAAAVAIHAQHLLPNHDNEYLLIAAERMMAGGDYLREINDPNPPLIMILYMPAVLLARLLQVEPYTAFSIHVGLLILASLWLMAGPLDRCLRAEGGIRTAALVGSAVVLAIVPGYEFGQREHLLAVLFMPYVFWSAARAIDGPARAGVADFLVLAAGATGAMVKPFFLVVPAAMLGLRLAGSERWRVLRDPAVPFFAAAALLYAAFVVGVYPHFLDLAALHGQVYFAWNRAWASVLDAMRDAVAMTALLSVLALLAPVGPAARHVLRTCLSAAVAGLLVALVQHKGWTYHVLPGLQFALCGLAVAAAVLLPRLRMIGPAAATAAGLLVAVGAASALQLLRPYQELVGFARARFAAQPLAATLRELAEGRSVLLVTSGSQMGFPSMARVRLGASQTGQLMLPGAARLAMGDAAQQALAARLRPFVIQALVDDLVRFRPDFVAVDRRREKQALPDDFDVLAYYADDATFQRQWSAYRLVRSVPGWDFYQRAAGT